MPEINGQDSSNQAEISRLKTIVAALSDKLATLLPQTEEMPSDVADFDTEVARQAKVEKLSQLFKEREFTLEMLDNLIDVLGDFIRAETLIRRDIEPLLHGIDKHDREHIRGDAKTNATVLARLGEFGVGKDVRRDRSERIPKLASLSDIHPRIISQIQKG
jgi:hypothetical protein